MKIVLVTMEYPPYRGGVGNYYFNLTQELIKKDFEILVLTAAFYKYFWPRWLKLFFEIRKVIKQQKPDWLWIGQVLPVGEAIYLIKKLYKIPYFVSTHGMDIMLPQRFLTKEKIMKHVLDNAEFITANSQFTKKELLNLGYSEEKVEVVYPCPNVSCSRYYVAYSKEQIEEIRNKLNLYNKKILLTVGRLVERKGQGMVIQAMPKLLEKFPNLVYLIIGDGPESSKLKAQSLKLGLNGKVIFLNNVSNEELPIYYQLADLFVMPAKNLNGDVEGFGIVYLEASSFGLPIVAGRTGGVMEAVIDQKTGLLIDSDSENDLIEKITSLLTNKELYQKLSEYGKTIVEQQFNWDKQAGKLISKMQETTKFYGRK